MRLTATVHQRIYFICLLVIVIGLLFSKPLVSIGEIALAVNWLWEGQLRTKLKRFWNNKAAVLIFSVFLLHIIGLLYTSDWAYGMHDLRIKLPLLLLPLIIGSSPPLERERFDLLMSVFITTVLIATFVCTFVFLIAGGLGSQDIRQISIFISHIRFSLLICLAMFALIYYAFKRTQSNEMRFVQLALAFWLLLFMIILQSMTGMVILAVTGYFALLALALKQAKQWVRLSMVSVLIAAPLLIAGFIYQRVSAFYNIEPLNYAELDKFSAGGEFYNHHKGQTDIENGHYVWTYVAIQELERSWEKRSHLQFKGKDLKGQPLHATLIRYMSSKGLRKDAVGMAKLNQVDIQAVERGIANVKNAQGANLSTRIDEVIGEFDRYFNGGNPGGNSVTQRLEFWKTGWAIVKEQPLLGVGTGDVKQAFKQQYEKMDSQLSQRYRLRAHNQYLTILLTFGVLGFVWFLFALLYPILLLKKRKNFLYMVFMSIALVSMLNEDTLETQVGITFFALFGCLLLFGWDENRKVKNLTLSDPASIGENIIRLMKAS